MQYSNQCNQVYNLSTRVEAVLLGNVRNTDIDSQCLHAILDFTNCPFVKSHSVFVHEKRTTLSLCCF